MTSQTPDIDTGLTALAELAEKALGRPLEPDILAALGQARAAFLQTQTEAAARLDAGVDGPNQYLETVAAAMKRAMVDTQAVLGNERFKAIFGAAGLNPTGMIHRDAFFQSEEERRRAGK